MCMRLEATLGDAAWDLSPAQALFRVLELDERERDAMANGVYSAFGAQITKSDVLSEYVNMLRN